MGLVLRTGLSLIPGNHQSWLLVLTKHRCSRSTDYGPVKLPGHVAVATSGPWRPTGLPALQTCLKRQAFGTSASQPPDGSEMCVQVLDSF